MGILKEIEQLIIGKKFSQEGKPNKTNRKWRKNSIELHLKILFCYATKLTYMQCWIEILDKRNTQSALLEKLHQVDWVP